MNENEDPHLEASLQVEKKDPVVQISNGIPVWVHAVGALPVTSEMVCALAEE